MKTLITLILICLVAASCDTYGNCQNRKWDVTKRYYTKPFKK